MVSIAFTLQKSLELLHSSKIEASRSRWIIKSIVYMQVKGHYSGLHFTHDMSGIKSIKKINTLTFDINLAITRLIKPSFVWINRSFYDVIIVTIM